MQMKSYKNSNSKDKSVWNQKTTLSQIIKIIIMEIIVLFSFIFNSFL